MYIINVISLSCMGNFDHDDEIHETKTGDASTYG